MFIKILKLKWVIIVFLLAGGAGAFVAESGNYRIQSDSVNVGGQLSESGSFKVTDTVGEMGTGDLSSGSYDLEGGFQAMLTDESILALSGSEEINLTPNIDFDGGSATGQGIWTVVTNNPSGYQLTVEADSNPALSSGSNSFDDYTPNTGVPDYSWDSPTSGGLFGFTVSGDDATLNWQDDGDNCGVSGSTSLDYCWDGLGVVQTVAEADSDNHPDGSEIVLGFKAETASDSGLPDGSYTANLTVTLVAL
ncbi:MAG: hypothetical protein ACOCU8_00545 [Patescibacteria group bacterium]